MQSLLLIFTIILAMSSYPFRTATQKYFRSSSATMLWLYCIYTSRVDGRQCRIYL